VFLLVFLSEKQSGQHPRIKRMSVLSTYKVVWKIIQLKPMKMLLLIMMTVSVSYDAEKIKNNLINYQV
jgi:hypothetical protein